MHELAKKLNKEKYTLVNDIKSWYNDYSWDGLNFVYNPHSILTLFRESKIKNYWFTSGTPSFLTRMIKIHHIDVTSLDNYRAGEAIFEPFDIERINVYSLLFQAGYLTVKSIEEAGGNRNLYNLSYPNLEVKESFSEHLLGEFSNHFANENGIQVR